MSEEDFADVIDKYGLDDYDEEEEKDSDDDDDDGEWATENAK